MKQSYAGKGFGREPEEMKKKEYREGIDMWEEPQEEKPLEQEEPKTQMDNKTNAHEKKIKPEEDIYPINDERIDGKLK